MCKAIPIEVKAKSLENFLLCATKDEQDLLLFAGVDVKAVKSRRPRNLGDNRKLPVRNRAASFSYKLSGKDCSREVCKRCFMNVYGITESRLKRICNLRLSGSSPRDKRGRHTPPNIMPDEVFKKVKEHIASFPVNISHYMNKEYYYLNSMLSVKRMWKMYNEKYPSDHVSYESYRNIFNS